MKMSKTHEFYPMITGTVKTIIDLIEVKDYAFVLFILRHYPDFQAPEEELRDRKHTRALLDELDRQYARWNKGGQQ